MEPLSPREAMPSAAAAVEDILSLSSTAEEALLGEASQAFLSRLRALGPLLGEALDWAAENAPERGLGLAAALWRYYVESGELSEGRHQLRWLLGLVPVPCRARLSGLTSSALLASVAGAHAEAALLAQEAMPLARALEEAVRQGYLELVLGRSAQAEGDGRLAVLHLEAARERFGEAGHAFLVARALLGLAEAPRAR